MSESHCTHLEEKLDAHADLMDLKLNELQAKLDLFHAETAAQLDNIAEVLNAKTTTHLNPNDLLGTDGPIQHSAD